MAQNITLWGASYQDCPGIEVPKTGGGTALFTDTTPTTAIASDVASGKVFMLADGSQATGSAIPGVVNLQYGVLRPDATLVKSFSYDKHIVADEGKTIPLYSTSSTTLLASSALSETYTISYDYNWFVMVKCLSIPEYSVETKGKGREEYAFSSTLYEVVELPVGAVSALIDPTKANTSRSVTLVATGAFSRMLYWSSSTAVTAYSTTSYGVVQGIVAPSYSSGTITFNSPNLIIRGHSTYFTSTYFNAVTDIRYQWKIELYRAQKNNLNIDGWGQYTTAMHIIDCATSSTHKLT